MTRLWLHGGFHKTGTTAVQAWAYSARRKLRRAGLVYPALRRRWWRAEHGHHLFAHTVAGRAGCLDEDHVERLCGEWQKMALDVQGSVLLSAEPVCRHVRGRIGRNRDAAEAHLDYLRYLASILSAFDVRPILVVRRQDEFVRSFYQEAVARGTNRTASMDFSKFRRKVGNERARFLPVIERFEEIFGRVTVLVYEDLCRGGLVRSFFSELGYQVQQSPRSIVRRSFSVRQTLIKRGLNAFIHDKEQNARLIRWLHSGPVVTALQEYLPVEPDLWDSFDERAEFLSGYAEENELLAKRAGFDGRCLFPPLKPMAGTKGVRGPDPEELKMILRALALKSGRKLRGVIGADAFDRIVAM